jgi:hypothetical protein
MAAGIIVAKKIPIAIRIKRPTVLRSATNQTIQKPQRWSLPRL